jgi:hypothetical protein
MFVLCCLNMQARWYMEIYRDGKIAWCGYVPGAEGVRSAILDGRENNRAELVRFIAPAESKREDIDDLIAMGAERSF